MTLLSLFAGACAVLGFFVAFLLWRRGQEVVLARTLGERLAAAEANVGFERAQRLACEQKLGECERRRDEVTHELTLARERLQSTQQRLAEEQQFIESSKAELKNTFEAAAAQALKTSSEQFLLLAKERLGAVRNDVRGDLDERRQAIETLLAPLRDTLGKLEQRTGEIERARVDAFAKIEQQVFTLAQATTSLNDRTTSLVTALRGSSQARGQWGEMVLRSVAEAAGMLEHCDFALQEVQADGKRPDMTVKLPGGRFIAVDAKAPLSAYYEACEAANEDARAEALARHASALRQHVRALKGRDYAGALAADLDLVVLFLPGDPILGAAFQAEPELQIDALRAKVLLATPTTLVALLRTVAIYWQQRAVAENAQTIYETARELYDRAAKFAEDLGKVGKGLRTALGAYDAAVGCFERRVLPMGQRLKEMKVAEQSKRELLSPGRLDIAANDAS